MDPLPPVELHSRYVDDEVMVELAHQTNSYERNTNFRGCTHRDKDELFLFMAVLVVFHIPLRREWQACLEYLRCAIQ